MEFICNTRQGSRLEALHRAAIEQAARVDAAVAYVTDINPFAELCWKHKKPLTLYARYDHTGPISPPVLDWFLAKQRLSADYELRLVPDIFHPKLIWWRGVGVYVGSANLTSRAWNGNFEAGIFLAEDELEEQNLVGDIDEFFREVRTASHPLSREVADEMTRMATKVFGEHDYRIEREFEKTRLLPRLASLISVTRVPRREKSKTEFLREWNATLQNLRDIADRVSLSENLPKWVTPGAAKGVLADQFLHAYYYNRVRDGHQYPYRDLYKKHHDQREAAVSSAIQWWRELTSAPSSEDIHIKEWAPCVRQGLAPGAVRQMRAEDFVELCSRIHALRNHALRVSYQAFGLTHKLDQMSGDERVRYFGNWLYKQRSPDESTPCDVIDFVLHGGSKERVPDRLFEVCFDPEKKIPHLGVSSLGEIVGWAMPDDFPPRNGRTSKALTALGFDVTIHSE